MHMILVSGTGKQAGKKISFGGKRLFADRAAPGGVFIGVGMAMRATEDMTDSVVFSRIQGCFNLFVLIKNGSAYRTDSRGSGNSRFFQQGRPFVFAVRERKQAVGKD